MIVKSCYCIVSFMSWPQSTDSSFVHLTSKPMAVRLMLSSWVCRPNRDATSTQTSRHSQGMMGRKSVMTSCRHWNAVRIRASLQQQQWKPLSYTSAIHPLCNGLSILGKPQFGNIFPCQVAMIRVTDNMIDIDGLVQDCKISSMLAMEILQSCSTPSIYLYSPHDMWCMSWYIWYHIIFYFALTIGIKH